MSVALMIILFHFCIWTQVPSTYISWSHLSGFLTPLIYIQYLVAHYSYLLYLIPCSFHLIPFSFGEFKNCFGKQLWQLFLYVVFSLGFCHPSVFCTLTSLLAVTHLPPDWSSSYLYSGFFVPVIALWCFVY